MLMFYETKGKKVKSAQKKIQTDPRCQPALIQECPAHLILQPYQQWLFLCPSIIMSVCAVHVFGLIHYLSSPTELGSTCL